MDWDKFHNKFLASLPGSQSTKSSSKNFRVVLVSFCSYHRVILWLDAFISCIRVSICDYSYLWLLDNYVLKSDFEQNLGLVISANVENEFLHYFPIRFGLVLSQKCAIWKLVKWAPSVLKFCRIRVGYLDFEPTRFQPRIISEVRCPIAQTWPVSKTVSNFCSKTDSDFWSKTDSSSQLWDSATSFLTVFHLCSFLFESCIIECWNPETFFWD